MPRRVLARSRSSINIYWMIPWKNPLVLQLNCRTTHLLLPKGSLDGQLLLWSPGMSPGCILISQHRCCGNLQEGTRDFAPAQPCSWRWCWLSQALICLSSWTVLGLLSICAPSFPPSLPATDRGTRGSPRAKIQPPAASSPLKLV